VVKQLAAEHQLSQRHACELVQVSRSTVRYQPQDRTDETKLVEAIRSLAEQHPSYGYRPLTQLLNRTGWSVNHKRVQRLWQQEGLQLPRRKVHKRRVGISTGQLHRATYPNHVWSYDFLEARTEQGGRLRMLAVLDEYTRQCLAIEVERTFPARKVQDLLEWLFLIRGRPVYLRSDNGPEFIAHIIQKWLAEQQCQTLYITPGSPWENPFIESFIGKFKAECLNRYWFVNGREARQLVDQWRDEYNSFRPHSSLGYLTPDEFAQQADILSL